MELNKGHRYNPSLGGHAPSHLRDIFEELTEAHPGNQAVPALTEYDGEEVDVRAVLGLLWNCTDIMPGYLCDSLGLSVGTTYAQGARDLMKRLAQ